MDKLPIISEADMRTPEFRRAWREMNRTHIGLATYWGGKYVLIRFFATPLEFLECIAKELDTVFEELSKSPEGELLLEYTELKELEELNDELRRDLYGEIKDG